MKIVPEILIGAFISTFISGQFSYSGFPYLGDVFGYDPFIRIAGTLAGGIILGLGTRWAGGCTSGHGINGSIQISLASIITVCCSFNGNVYDRVSVIARILRVVNAQIPLIHFSRAWFVHPAMLPT